MISERIACSRSRCPAVKKRLLDGKGIIMNMRKLYFKKLFTMAVMSLVFFGIYFVSSFLLGTFINFIKSTLLKSLIFLAVPATFLLFIGYRRRVDDAEMRRAYLKDTEGTKVNFKDRFIYVLKSAHFRADISAFATVLLLILSIAFITGGAKGYFWINVLSFAISFVMYETIYIVADFICWMRVHKKWIEEKF